MNSLPSSVLIVGGGTAGWMSACMLAKAWQGKHVNIELLESSTIPTVGVGEGSTPFLQQFFAHLGISETQWMSACNATYKLGISFENWTSSVGSTAYFHPFFSALDLKSANQFFSRTNARRAGEDTTTNPADYFITAQMVDRHISPKDYKGNELLDYAYHFDAGLLGKFLKDFAVSLGVKHTIGKVKNVYENNGLIQCVETENAVINADTFIDCSGFRGLLAKQTLQREFVSYADTLFNDAAVAIPTPLENTPSQYQTRSIALKNGWQWHIPLQSRIGNGYVYSQKFCDADQAEMELRHALNLTDSDADARHLRMQVGRLNKHWEGNCLAIGLAQGFIEPLEATALMLVQYALQAFIGHWDGTPISNVKQDRYNTEINRMFDGVRDYIAAHYLLNDREDTDYWRACREEILIPDTLAFLLEVWDSDASFEQALDQVGNKLVYLRPSWYCILAGMDRFKMTSTHNPTRDSHMENYWEEILQDNFTLPSN